MLTRELIENHVPVPLSMLGLVMPAQFTSLLDREVHLEIFLDDCPDTGGQICFKLSLGDQVYEWSADEICEFVNGRPGTNLDSPDGLRPELAGPGGPGTD